jgi:predicted DNA-binding protein YlxM (UPF0122 family)
MHPKDALQDMKDVRSEALLFDFYGNLLKGRQKEIYEASVMDDMSLSEISLEYGISRQAVSAMLMRCRNTLKGYEDKLKLIERFQETERLAKEIKEISSKGTDEDSMKIAELTDRILGEL